MLLSHELLAEPQKSTLKVISFTFEYEKDGKLYNADLKIGQTLKKTEMTKVVIGTYISSKSYKLECIILILKLVIC